MAIVAPKARKYKWLFPTLLATLFSVLIFVIYKSIIETNYYHEFRNVKSAQRVSFGNNDRFGGGIAQTNYPLSPEVTVVTAFLPPYPHMANQGATGDDKADPYTRWMEWSKLFRNMSNPVIAYLGSVQYMFWFESTRGMRSMSSTNMTIVDIQDLDIHKDLTTSQFFQDPNLVNLIYQHSKYELLLHAAKYNPFRTTHMLWLDSGTYNAAYQNDHTYKVKIPENFDDTRVAYRTQKDFVSGRNVEDIFTGKETYMDGNFLIGEVGTVKRWCEMYLTALKKYLSKGKLASDETTLYAMMSDSAEEYRNLVTTYKASDVAFAVWFQKMSGLNKPYEGMKDLFMLRKIMEPVVLEQAQKQS